MPVLLHQVQEVALLLQGLVVLLLVVEEEEAGLHLAEAEGLLVLLRLHRPLEEQEVANHHLLRGSEVVLAAQLLQVQA